MDCSNNGNGFTIRRALPAMDGFVVGIDKNVKKHLDELNQLLSKRIFSAVGTTAGSTGEKKDRRADGESAGKEEGNAEDKGKEKAKGGISVPDVLIRELTPKRVPSGNEPWKVGSFARILSDTGETQTHLTLSEHIDMTPALVELKYAFQKQRQSIWPKLDYNTRAVLDGHTNIEDYLIAFAFHVAKLTDVNALCSFVLKNGRGGKRIVEYAIVSASRTLIDEQQLQVANYNDDDGRLAKALRTSKISLSATAFVSEAMSKIKAFVFDSDELELINTSKLAPVPDDIKPLLVKLIQKSPFPITPHNVDHHLPTLMSQAYAAQGYLAQKQLEPILDDQEFRVQFQDDPSSTVSDISRSAVRCAALLYHGMVLGDELDVFGAANYFTHKYLVRGGLEIKDMRLRMDLRDYVFSERFLDLKTNLITDRTRPAERQMFYRQVFNEGNAEVTEDVLLNSQFKRLWKVLMLESAKYLQRAQASFQPDNFVSRQNVMQSVEDLQYNLSLSCTGMVNVIAPLIDAELNFVITRILKHPEVVSQVVPSGGGWQRVVETLCAARKHSRGRATTLYNKARLGEAIIRSVAEYTPADFETNAEFSKFISQVDAYITTQSILQEALTDDLLDGDKDDTDSVGGEGEDTDHMEEPVAGSAPRESTTAVAGGNEWDF